MTDTPHPSEPERLAETPENVPEEISPPAPPPPPAEKPANRHIGRKIWYGFIIFLSGLVILMCAIGAIGTWVIEQAVSDGVVLLLGAMENGAGRMRQAGARVDALLVETQQVTLGISQSIGQVSQNITDKGLVMTLLPEEQEQKLTGLGDQIRDGFAATKELVASALQMYQSINRMPFISLPGPDPEQVDAIQATLDNVQSDVSEARSAIQELRTGAAARVDRVTNAVVMLSGRLQDGRDKIAELDSQLASVQERADQLQQVIPTVLAIVAVVLTLFLIYVGYTQVEVIRLYVSKWKRLGQ